MIQPNKQHRNYQTATISIELQHSYSYLPLLPLSLSFLNSHFSESNLLISMIPIQLIVTFQMYDLNYHHADQILKSPEGHPLFIGDASAAEDLDWLKSNNIKTVMTVASGFTFHYPAGVRHIRYDLEDRKNENIGAHFDAAAAQIDRHLKNGGILVHCGAGISRSPTLVIAFLIKHRNMTFLQALKMIKTKRPQVCPNLGFQLQLKSYERLHRTSTNLFIVTSKRRQKKQLPEIVKYHPSSTFSKSFNPQPQSRPFNLLLSKSLKPPQRKERSELECLRRMAEFRFGITNMSRWKISDPSGEEKN